MAPRKKTTKKTPAKKAPEGRTATSGGAPPPAPIAPPPPTGTTALERRAVLDAIANHYNEEGHMVMVRGDEAPNPYILRRPTGITELDIDLGGGFPAGGTCFVSGPDNCIAEGSFIQFETRHADGRRSNHKGGKVEDLYRKFHNLELTKDGKRRRPTIKGLQFFAPSVDDDYSVFQNRILNVVCTGTQECFELRTKGGRRLVATRQHKLMTPTGYTELQYLNVGATVYIHDCITRKKAVHDKDKRRAEVNVKHHPTLKPQVRKVKKGKWEKEYTYYRMYKSRAVVEAAMNDLEYDKYIELLNDGEIDGLETLNPNQVIHHRDEDTTNDELDNLLVVTRAGHMAEHWNERKRDLSYVAVQDEVVGVTPVGKRTTYDLKMAAPFSNYVADKLVVHNCGKTWLMMQVMAMQQKLYGDEASLVMGITEGGFPYDQAIRVGLRVAVPDEMILQWQQARMQRGFAAYSEADIGYFKQQVGDFRIVRGSTGEEVLRVILDIIGAKACSVICIDSLQGLQPNVDAGKELNESEKMMAHATMMGRFFKKYIPLTTGLNGVNETTLLMTQQVRSNKAKSEASANVQKYIKDWAITGSYSARHFKLVDLVLYDGALQKKDMPGGGRVVVGKDLKWETEKGKAGTHDNITGMVKYSYTIQSGVDFIGTVLDSAQQRGVLRKVGSRYMLVRPENNEALEALQAPSLKAFRRCMELDPDFEFAVRMEVLAAAGVQCLYR